MLDPSLRKRNVIMILIGVSGLLLKSWFSDSISELLHCYLGNLTVSFAVYFLISAGVDGRLNRITYALIALLVVEAFELADGFGVMANVYDPFDYYVNALGISLAWLVDVFSSSLILVAPSKR